MNAREKWMNRRRPSSNARTHTHTPRVIQTTIIMSGDWRERESSNSIVLLVTHIFFSHLRCAFPVAMGCCYKESGQVPAVLLHYSSFPYYAPQRLIWCQRSLTDRIATFFSTARRTRTAQTQFARTTVFGHPLNSYKRTMTSATGSFNVNKNDFNWMFSHQN